MSKFLVLEPYLSYFQFSQTVTKKQIEQLKIDLGQSTFDKMIFLPYSPQLSKTLKSQKKDYYSIPNYQPKY
jgi:hypothetical protein